MSKLIDRLNQAAEVVTKPIGFGKLQPAVMKTPMPLIARSTQATDVDHLDDYITGADAILFTKLGLGAKTLPKIAKSMSDIPWGLWLEDIDSHGIKPVMEAGGDFIVFPASTALAIPEDDKIGKILQVEASLSEGLLRAVNELPVDAVLIADDPGKESSLTWHHLMLFQRFADLLTKPLLVSIPLKVPANELQILWKTGVDGVVANIGMEKPAEGLKELHHIIDQLTFPPRPRKKMEALLPRITEETSAITEAEEEEEEEE